MKKTALSLAVACALGVSGAAMANGYQYELSVGYDRLDQTGPAGYNGDTWSISGTYYLDVIDDSTGPLAEAAFLNKASFLNAQYGYLAKDLDGDAFSVGGEFVTENHGLIFGARYSWLDDAEVRGFAGSTDSDVYELTVGKYLTDNTTARLSYQYGDIDGDLSDYKEETLGLNVRHLTGDIGYGRYIAVEGDLQRSEVDVRGGSTYKATLMGVGADLYVNRHFSFGAGYEYIVGDDELEGDGFEVRARYHINPQFFVSANYGHTKPDDFYRAKYWGVEVATRF